jgi:GT2 family glycosyltransferase
LEYHRSPLAKEEREVQHTMSNPVPVTSGNSFSLGVSIVLYETPMSRIAKLLGELKQGGAAKIFVIDNSPPGYDASAEQYRSDMIERVCTGRNLGFGRAHNIAIARSVGMYKYHLICNPDIAIPDDSVARMINFMDCNPDVGLCMPMLVGPGGEMQYCCRRSPVLLDYLSQIVAPQTWGRRRRSRLEMRSQDYHQPMEARCLSGCFMLFRSDVLRRLGGFDDRFFLYFEDFDLSMRSSLVAKNVYFPAARVVHERQSAHRNSWHLKAIFARSALAYFSKWGWFRTRISQEQGPPAFRAP